MGCGASSGNEPGYDADAPDPRLAKYLAAKGVDVSDVKKPVQMGISPAEARRRGLAAGQTPGSHGTVRDAISLDHKALGRSEAKKGSSSSSAKEKKPRGKDRDKDRERDSSRSRAKSTSTSDAKRRLKKAGNLVVAANRMKGDTAGMKKKVGKERDREGKSSSSSSRKKEHAREGKHTLKAGSSAARTKLKKAGNAVIAAGRMKAASKSSRSKGRGDSKSSSKGGERTRVDRKGKAKAKGRGDGDSKPARSSSSVISPASTEASGQTIGEDDMDADQDADRLARYMAISGGRRNALPPDPSMMAQFAA